MKLKQLLKCLFFTPELFLFSISKGERGDIKGGRACDDVKTFLKSVVQALRKVTSHCQVQGGLLPNPCVGPSDEDRLPVQSDRGLTHSSRCIFPAQTH